MANTPIDRLAEVPRSGAAPQLRYLFRAMRPRQWTKNGIVFLALIFSVGQEYHLSDPSTLDPEGCSKSLVAFACFAMVSSADYLVNDIRDIEADRAHPTKRNRPIPAGLLPVRTAWVCGGGARGGRQRRRVRARTGRWGSSSSAYTVLMLAYSYQPQAHRADRPDRDRRRLRPARDGGRARDRRADLAVAVRRRRRSARCSSASTSAAPNSSCWRPAQAATARSSTSTRIPLLDQMGSIVTGALLIAYGLYTFTAEGLPDEPHMMLTIPFVLYGIFRYLYLVNVKKEGGSPEEVLLRDVPIMLTAIGWVTTAGTILSSRASSAWAPRRTAPSRSASRHQPAKRCSRRTRSSSAATSA